MINMHLSLKLISYTSDCSLFYLNAKIKEETSLMYVAFTVQWCKEKLPWVVFLFQLSNEHMIWPKRSHPVTGTKDPSPTTIHGRKAESTDPKVKVEGSISMSDVRDTKPVFRCSTFPGASYPMRTHFLRDVWSFPEVLKLISDKQVMRAASCRRGGTSTRALLKTRGRNFHDIHSNQSKTKAWDSISFLPVSCLLGSIHPSPKIWKTEVNEATYFSKWKIFRSRREWRIRKFPCIMDKILVRITASNDTFLPNSGLGSWQFTAYRNHPVHLIWETEGQWCEVPCTNRGLLILNPGAGYIMLTFLSPKCRK